MVYQKLLIYQKQNHHTWCTVYNKFLKILIIKVFEMCQCFSNIILLATYSTLQNVLRYLRVDPPRREDRIHSVEIPKYCTRHSISKKRRGKFPENWVFNQILFQLVLFVKRLSVQILELNILEYATNFDDLQNDIKTQHDRAS